MHPAMQWGPLKFIRNCTVRAPYGVGEEEKRRVRGRWSLTRRGLIVHAMAGLFSSIKRFVLHPVTRRVLRGPAHHETLLLASSLNM